MNQGRLLQFLRNLREIRDEPRERRDECTRDEQQQPAADGEKANEHDCRREPAVHPGLEPVDERRQEQLQQERDEDDEGQLRQEPERRQEDRERHAEQDGRPISL